MGRTIGRGTAGPFAVRKPHDIRHSRTVTPQRESCLDFWFVGSGFLAFEMPELQGAVSGRSEEAGIVGMETKTINRVQMAS